MPWGSDGGKWALAGFLYQIVGTLSITARALTGIRNDNAWDEVDALVALIGNGGGLQTHHEQLGQDAVFTTRDQYVIAQFKYSSTPTKIRRSELLDIIRKLDRSAQQAASEGQMVTACVLVTNREFTTGVRAAEGLWEHERSQEREYDLRCHHASLQNLRAKFHEFCERFGVLDREIEPGADRLIGRVLRQTGELFGASIGEEHILESLTGCPGARPLTVSAVAPRCSSQLNEFAESVGIARPNDTLIRREVLRDIARAITERALVTIYGDGGCGKSIVLWQLLTELLQQSTGCVMITLAKNLPRSWITNTVHEWRGLPAGTRPSDDRETAIRRLEVANSNLSRQIIWLGVDGLDEGVTLADQRSLVQEIVRWFWTKDRECQETGHAPPATLVVSSRCKDDLATQWLDVPYDYSGERPRSIAVGDFSAQEVAMALRLTFAEFYPGFASPHPEGLGLQDIDYSDLPFSDAPPYPPSASLHPDVLEALRHPAMWRALLNLERTLQVRAVQGERQAIHNLAHEFIKWFYWKLGRREQSFLSFGEALFIDILCSIAAHTTSTAAYSRDSDWTRPACHNGRMGGREATTLYDEALSGGLITEDASLSWRWRHMIVYEYLASRAHSG
jgi:energy-coupling factor transporter ATP-binding protein EcfA2